MLIRNDGDVAVPACERPIGGFAVRRIGGKHGCGRFAVAGTAIRCLLRRRDGLLRRRDVGAVSEAAGRWRRAAARATAVAMVTSVLVVAVFATHASAAELTGREVIARMRQARALGGDDAMKMLRVTLVDRDGDAIDRTLVAYQRQCDGVLRNLVVFLGPEDVAGSALLSWARADGSADMWLYLPELGRVRQLNAAARSESFLGTDLTYEDLSGSHLDVRTHRLLGEEEMDGRPTYKVESVPNGDSPYRRVLTWIDREAFLPVRIKYFDHAGAHLKTGTFRDVRMVKGIPTIFSFEMHNVQTGHRTRVSLLEADYHGGLACERFTRRYLTRMR